MNVSIIGRANVGKSTLFNRIVGKNLSITSGVPGVTRDRLFSEACWNGKSFNLIDTGGIEISILGTRDYFEDKITEQAKLAIEISDVIIFVVDIKNTNDKRDAELANMLRQTKKPLILACNKNDNYKSFDYYEFYSLGIENIYPISAVHGSGVNDLLDKTIEYISNENDSVNDLINVSIVGRPNAGKSSLVNRILNENRAIVSDIAGTTRDSIDIRFKKNGKNYNLIDTAGMRKNNIKEQIESISVVKTLASINKSEISLVLIDALEGLTVQDERIIGYIDTRGKSFLLIVNKWDLVEKDEYTAIKFEKELREKLAFIKYLNIIFISAKYKPNVDKIFNKIDEILLEYNKRVTTGRLNYVLAELLSEHQPPSDKGKRLKIYYMTQSSVAPPTFILFINSSSLMHFSYLRYIENKIRDNFDFNKVPIKLVLREKPHKYKKDYN